MPGDTNSPVAIWQDAARRMLSRASHTADALTHGFPHWANSSTGTWTTTPDGDWTGGALPGMLWLGAHWTKNAQVNCLALDWCLRLRPRAKRETAFKGFGFYYGAALGQALAGNAQAQDLALEAAESLRQQFDPRLDLIPLGKEAEEANEIGKAFSSIDSLQAVPLLFWAARVTGDARYADCAASHTSRVLEIHTRPDGGIVQSSELDAANGKTLRHFTHKGASDTSVWGRAQAWGMVYAAMAYAQDRSQTRWLEYGMSAANWWLDHVPQGMVAFWDFDDPAIPNTEHDTAATAIVCNALLKLADLAPDAARRERYATAAARTARALVDGYLTPTQAGDARPEGMLTGGCFNKRMDSRAHDAATNSELIFGSYYLFESLLILAGVLQPNTI
jgi:unsaturated chondroitin disaccharide hydrolase